MGWYDDMGIDPTWDENREDEPDSYFPKPRGYGRSYKSPSTHNLIVKIKRETPKAIFVVAQNPDKKGEYREYWIPKSQISATKDSKKRAGLKIITISDWIHSKLQPSSQIIYEDYDYVTKPKAEPGKRQYTIGNRKFTPKPSADIPPKGAQEKDPLEPDDPEPF